MREMDEEGEEMCDGGYTEEIWWGRVGLLSSTLYRVSGDSRLVYCLRYMYPRYWAMKRSLMVHTV